MDINKLKDSLKKEGLLDQNITKYTKLIDDKMNQQGILFFVPIGSKEIKIVIPSPFHEQFDMENGVSYNQLLSNTHIIVLK